MPQVTTKADNGENLQVHLPAVFLWAVGIMTTLTTTAIIAATALLIGLNTRVTVIENTQLRVDQVATITQTMVPRGEYNLHLSTTSDQLKRILDTQDDILAKLGR